MDTIPGHRPLRLGGLILLFTVAAFPSGALAQTHGRVLAVGRDGSLGRATSVVESDVEVSASSRGELPDAPSAVAEEGSAASFPLGAKEDRLLQAAPAVPPVAGRFKKKIEPGQRAQDLTTFDQVLLGLRGLRSPFSAIGWVVSASYEQGIDGTPNYPQTTKGYFQRLGAISARNASSKVFGDAALAPLLRQDIRYYRVGPGRSVLYRLRYAASRQLIGRTESGRPIFNTAEIGGNLGSALLTNAYFPRGSRGVGETAKTFGGLVGGGALGYTLVEFFADTLGRIF